MEENKEEKKVNLEKEEKKTPEKKAAKTTSKTESTEKKATNKTATKKAEVKKEGVSDKSKTTTKTEKNTKNAETNNAKTADTNKTSKTDDLSFKKVEMDASTKKKMSKNEKKSKHGFFKFILILVIIIIVAYCAFFVRNLIILNNIKDIISQTEGSQNYSYTSVATDGSGSTTTVNYYKDKNVERTDLNSNNNKAVIWYDGTTDEKIFSVPDARKATIDYIADNEMVNLPYVNEIQSQNGVALLSLMSLVYSEEYNSTDCYVICYGNTEKIWVSKDNGLVVKRESKIGTEMNTVEYKDFKFGNVQIYKPDLTGYEVNQ